MRNYFNDAKLRAGQILREMKEKREERRASKPQDPPNVTVSAELVRGVKWAAWVAYFALMYFLWERVLDVSQAQHSTLEVTHFGIWSNLNLAIFFPLIVGYLFVVVGVPYVAKISIPTLVSLNWTEHFWPKLVSLFITLLVSTVLITGTATVGSNAIIESERGAAVAVAELQQSRSVLESQLERRRGELRDMMNNGNAYLAQAASVGAEEWQRSYIEQTPRNDPQRDRIVRAIGAARSADAVRADIRQLETQLDGMQTTAAVSSEVVTERTQTLNGVMDFLNTFWVLMLAVVMDLTCLFMPWIAMRLEQKRNAQLGMAGGIPLHPGMLEDHSKEASIFDMSPGEAARAVFAEGGTREQAEAAAREAARVTTKRRKYEDMAGEDITDYVEKNGRMVKMPQRDPRTGKFKATVEVPARDPGSEDKGVPQDGGNRTARSGVTLAGEMELPATIDPEEVPQSAEGEAVETDLRPERPLEREQVEGGERESGEHVDERGLDRGDDNINQQLDLSEELPVFEDEPNTQTQDQEQDQREPETNPARLIAAE